VISADRSKRANCWRRFVAGSQRARCDLKEAKGLLEELAL